MKKILFALAILLYGQLAWSFTIATGPSGGTYFQIAQDIKTMGEKEGIELRVIPTKGSFENIELLTTGKAELAIVQLDALRYVSDVVKQQAGLNVLDKIKVVLNLYPEEIHIVSNKKEITSFYHLEGKRVSAGPQESGTALTAELLFSLYDIKATKSYDAPEDAVKKLQQGELDALVFVGGAPVPFIEKLETSVHFVRLPTNPILEEIYLRKKLGKDLYRWAAGETETYAVPSAIMGLDIRDEKYVAQMQQLVLSILNGREYLETKGHPKWKSSIVRLYFPNAGYEPTNRIIDAFNTIDRNGYKVIKK
jgi:TRAP transporter TAXI family solute receptor